VVFKQGSLKRQNEERGGPKNMPGNRDMAEKRHREEMVLSVSRRFRLYGSRGVTGCFADSVAVQ
jgi:hypothetical protein